MKKQTILSGMFSGIISCIFISGTYASNGQDVTQRTGTTLHAQGLALGIDAGYGWGNLDTNLRDNTTGNSEKREGKDIDVDMSSLGMDLRYYFGLPLFQNNVRRPAFCGMWGRVNFDKSERGLNLDLHPTSGIDTTLTLDRNGFLMPYCGAGLFSIQQFLEFYFYLGARFEFTELAGRTDETGGGGQRETFRDTKTAFGPTLGFEGEMPLFLGNEYNRSALYLGVAADRTPDKSADGRSGVGFDYDFEVESGWNSRAYFGLRTHF